MRDAFWFHAIAPIRLLARLHFGDLGLEALNLLLLFCADLVLFQRRPAPVGDLICKGCHQENFEDGSRKGLVKGALSATVLGL